MADGILVSQPAIKPMSPALEGGFFFVFQFKFNFIYLRTETEMNIFNKGYSSQRRQTAWTIIHLKKKQRYIKQKSEDMEGKSKNILS